MSPTAPGRLARYYRSRPLVGGSLIVLSGIVVFLSTQLDLGRIHVQVGIEGFQSLLIPIALVALGALIVADPAHRIFYGVIALAVAVYAIVGVNLGGFLAGTILGITGAVVALSWMPPQAPSEQGLSPVADAADADLLRLEDLMASSDTPAPEPRPFAGRPADTGRTTRHGLRTLAVVAAVVGAGAVAAAAPAQAAHAQSPLCTGLLGILCPASPTLAPTPGAPTPSPAASGTASPEAQAGAAAPTGPASPAPSSQPDPAPSPSLPAGVPPSAAALVAPQAADGNVALDASAPVVAAEPATLSAGYLSQTNGRYVDTVLLRRPDGSTVRALEILGDAGLLKNVRLHGAGGHHGAGIDASQLDVAGPIHFYAAAFTGKAFGILPLSWNVDSPPPLGVPMPPFSDVTVELVYFAAGGQTLTASRITPQ